MKKEIKLERMRNTWAEIDLDAIVHNFREARKILPQNTKISAVLKANAYGHGAVKIGEVLIENKVDQLAVACLSEALELRKHYPEIPILVMGYTPDELFIHAVKNKIILTLFELEQARKLSEISERLNETAVVHIKIDTGLNRLGLKPNSKAVGIIENIYRLRHIYIEGIYTHLALTNPEADEVQYQLFMGLIQKLQAKGIDIPVKHMNDSNGMVRYPNYNLEMVRLGGFLFGVTKPGLYEKEIRLEPTMTFKTQITRIEELEIGEAVGYDSAFVAQQKCRIGTLAVGYSDGYVRSLSGVGTVGIKGKKAPVVGIICMDQAMIDLTEVPEAAVGDEVLLFGRNRQNEITVTSVAEKIDTNRNEILGGISRRVPRVYLVNSCITEVVDYLLD